MHMSLSELWDMVMNREAWRALIHGVTKSRTWLSDWTELNWTEIVLTWVKVLVCNVETCMCKTILSIKGFGPVINPTLNLHKDRKGILSTLLHQLTSCYWVHGEGGCNLGTKESRQLTPSSDTTSYLKYRFKIKCTLKIECISDHIFLNVFFHTCNQKPEQSPYTYNLIWPLRMDWEKIC